MNITITSKSINNGKQHVISVPFIGTFTVDQKDKRKAIDFALKNNRRNARFFLNSLAIDSLQSAIEKREKQIMAIV